MEDLFTAVLSPSANQHPQMPQQIQGAQSLHPGLHPSQPNSGLLEALDECYGNYWIYSTPLAIKE